MTVYACMKRCAPFVGNDSGLMHMASAADVPTLGLFGPSDDRRYRPLGRRTAVVRTRGSVQELVGAPGFDRRTSPSLMNSLGVDEVAAAAMRLLAAA